MPELEGIKPAVCLIVCNSERGTGYLVDDRHVVTCEHVVRSGPDAQVWLGDDKLEAKVIKIDDVADCAVLELAAPVKIQPLQIATPAKSWEWFAYGFPGLADLIGLPISGTIQDRRGRDVLRRPAIVLYSDMAAAGQGPMLGGFSGSPVIVEGKVAGHLKRVLSSKDRPGRPELGYLFATPAEEILKVLGWPAEAPPEAVRTVSPGTAAPLGEGEFHLFVSYNSKSREWARALVERLESYKLRVFIDQQQLQPGDQLANTIQRGLSRSRNAVVLITRGWLDSPWCQEESNVLLKRAVEDPHFRLIPLRLDDVEVPALLAAQLYLDFRDKGRPEGPELDKLIYTLLGEKIPEAQSIEAQVRQDHERSVGDMLQRIDAEAITAERVYQFWQQLQKTSVPDISVTLRAADRLISLAAPRLSLELLQVAGAGVRARQLRALAMGKLGDIDGAIVELERLENEGLTDAETGGILAGRYRQKGDQTRFAQWYAKSYDTYRRYFERTGDPYCGINAAQMALQHNERSKAVEICLKITNSLGNCKLEELTYWNCATLGQAFLILGDTEKAREWYSRAALKAAAFDQDRAVMRRYARETLKGLNLPEGLLDDVLPVPQTLAFFGHTIDDPDRPTPRFPRSLVPFVRTEIRQRLDKFQVNVGVSSACPGSDLLFLDELTKRGGQATVVLPAETAEFEATYLFGNWVSKFRELLDNPNVKIKVAQPRAKEDVWDACRREIRDAEEVCAKVLQQPVRLLVVWDGSSKSYVQSAVDQWTEEGDPVEVIQLPPANHPTA